DRNGLKTLFHAYGRINNIKIIVEPKTGQSRGMAFVELGTPAEAKRAIEELDGQVIDGRTVKANFATPLKKTSMGRSADVKEQKSDVDFQSKQLMKKARNLAKRKANPLQFKVASKKA